MAAGLAPAGAAYASTRSGAQLALSPDASAEVGRQLFGGVPLAPPLAAATAAASPSHQASSDGTHGGDEPPPSHDGASDGTRGGDDTAAAPGPIEPEKGAEPPAPRGGGRKLELALPIEIEVHGRVLMQVSADERDAWDRQLEMSSARLGLEAHVGAVKTVVEADLASDPLVEDAYVRVDLPRATRVTAGRFKAPFSERRLESGWALPLVTRGLVDRYLVNRNGLGGRRLGVAGALRPWGGRLHATAGLFAGDPSALEAASDAGEDWAGRVAIRGWDALELGVSGYLAGAGTGPTAAPERHAGGAFANVDLGAIEGAVEGFVGRIAEGRFAAGTALVSWRLRAGDARRLRITPVAGVEALQLSGATRGVGYGVIAGGVISWTEGLKVKLQGEWARRPGDATPAGALAAEVGTRF